MRGDFNFEKSCRTKKIELKEMDEVEIRTRDHVASPRGKQEKTENNSTAGTIEDVVWARTKKTKTATGEKNKKVARSLQSRVPSVLQHARIRCFE